MVREKLDLDQLRRAGLTPHYFVAAQVYKGRIYFDPPGGCAHREPGPNGQRCSRPLFDPIHLPQTSDDPAAV